MVCLILPPHPMTVRWLAFPGETLIPLTQKTFVAQQWNMRAQEWDKPPIQQLHTLIPLAGNLWHSWGNFTYNHFPLIYIYPICTLCISPCFLYVFPLVTSQLLTRITMDFSFVFIFCVFANLATNQYYAFHSMLYFEKFYWNCLSSVSQTMKIKHGSCITEI